ncbi:MAG: acyltransferase [Novosphingobium sp.]|nr:acyltransferase [Novosphingobium sp.]
MTDDRRSFVASQRFDTLDALRGICAVLVVLFHFTSSGTIGGSAFIRRSWLFVDYFFVLSGFVIAHGYGDRLASRGISIARFMGLRLGRLYPLHFVVLLAFVAVELVLLVFQDRLGGLASRPAFTGSRDITGLVQSLLLLNFFDSGHGLSWNGPSWTIAAEFWTYLLFALVLFVSKGRFAWVAGLIVLLALAWLVAVPGTLAITVRGGLIRCIMGFGIGLLTYRFYRRFGGPGGTVKELLTVAAALLYVGMCVPGPMTIAAPFVFAVGIFVLASQNGAVSRVLSWPLFQFLGLTSYSIYLVHHFVQARLSDVLQVAGIFDVTPSPAGTIEFPGSPLLADAVSLAMLAMVLATSYVSYHLVEKPGRDLSRRWLNR